MTTRIPVSRSTLTDTQITIADVSEDWIQSTQAQALMGWCRAHGLDPAMMPMPCTIVRDVPNCRVSTDYVVLCGDGHAILEASGSDPYAVQRTPFEVQLDKPPAPWPAEVLRG